MQPVVAQALINSHDGNMGMVICILSWISFNVYVHAMAAAIKLDKEQSLLRLIEFSPALGISSITIAPCTYWYWYNHVEDIHFLSCIQKPSSHVFNHVTILAQFDTFGQSCDNEPSRCRESGRWSISLRSCMRWRRKAGMTYAGFRPASRPTTQMARALTTPASSFSATNRGLKLRDNSTICLAGTGQIRSCRQSLVPQNVTAGCNEASQSGSQRPSFLSAVCSLMGSCCKPGK